MRRIYIDGSSVPNDRKVVNHAQFCVVVVNEDGKQHQWKRVIGNKLNNEAEYEALVAALEYCAASSERPDTTIYTDSRLLIGHVMKGWKCQDKFKVYLAVIRVLLPLVKLEWIPREQNIAGKVFEK